MIRVTVDSIRVSLLTQHRVVVLRELDSKRFLPIWIGPFEADAIALALQGTEPQRPLTHDLLKSVIGELGGTVSHILVNDIQDNTFYARIVVEQGAHTVEIDARPSDAIALAVRTEVPIYVENHVIDQLGVFFDEEEQAGTAVPPPPSASGTSEPATPADSQAEPEVSEEGLSAFKNFINTLDTKRKDDKQ